MRFLYFISLVMVLVLLQACTKTPEYSLSELSKHQDEIEDLKTFPQNISAYLPNLKKQARYLGSQSSYDEKYFEPWNYTKPPFEKELILWPFSSYTYGKSYGENLKLLKQEWFTQMKLNGNYDAYGSLNQKAISLEYLNLRNFPTQKPLFKDPSIAGEGFPFDYMQNSGIHANEPLFVSHLSADGEWAYVFTAYATGWVEKNGISFISEDVAKQWQEARQIELIDEYYPIKDLDGNFVFQSRVGMRLALISVEDPHAYIALAITAGKHNMPTYTKVSVPKSIAHEGQLLFNEKNIEHITQLMLKSHYGWGGLYQEKDCSSTLRDLYAPFGVWLPRNSTQQAKVGRVISLEELSINQKREKIIEQGVPFETLLYKKGHILLYLGEYKGKITVLHNVWGIKTLEDGKEGRKIIGRTVVSSLELGKERKNYDKDKGILSQLVSMNIVTQKEQTQSLP